MITGNPVLITYPVWRLEPLKFFRVVTMRISLQCNPIGCRKLAEATLDHSERE